MTANSPPYALQASSHSAQLFRQAISTLLGSAGGTVDPGDYLVTQNGTPNMSVNVAGGVPGGRIWIPGTTSAGVQGLYYGFNDGTVNVPIAASNPTNPRIDIIVAQVQDAAYAGAVNSFQIAAVTGTPAGSPVAPSTPASSLKLANVAVAALVSTIVTANITDTRISSSLSLPFTYATGGGRGGKSIISATESRSNAAYGLMTTPDRVQSVILGTDHLLAVGYQATWQQAVVSQARAAIFVGANQLKIAQVGSGAPVVQEATNGTAALADGPLSSATFGLAGVANGVGGGSADVTTGQVLGLNLAAGSPAAGFCLIFAAAGTYDISVQFKSLDASAVTVKNRKLWVWTLPFS